MGVSAESRRGTCGKRADGGRRPSDEIPADRYEVLYYGLITGASLLAGWLAAVVVLLYGTISDIVEVSGLRREDHPVVAREQEPEVDGRPQPEDAESARADRGR